MRVCQFRHDGNTEPHAAAALGPPSQEDQPFYSTEARAGVKPAVTKSCLQDLISGTPNNLFSRAENRPDFPTTAGTSRARSRWDFWHSHSKSTPTRHLHTRQPRPNATTNPRAKPKFHPSVCTSRRA